jgi:hypothetical protein
MKGAQPDLIANVTLYARSEAAVTAHANGGSEEIKFAHLDSHLATESWRRSALAGVAVQHPAHRGACE